MGLNRKRTLDEVIHDFVVHKKKKVGGTWVKPKYVQLFRHQMPGGGAIRIKGGTRIIDGIWRHASEVMSSRSPSVNERGWDNRVRSAQRLLWSTGSDLWSQTGV
eukprot:6883334-Pyramimonas_sp.AAC.1